MNKKYTLLSLAILCAIAQISVACSNCDEQKAAEANKIKETRTCPCQKPPRETKVSAEVAIGELADKITILEIKMEHISDEAKLQNIATELASLKEIYKSNVEQTPELQTLKRRLLEINRQLWDIEDAIRDKEKNKEFDAEFIEIARSVYYTNDERCAVKRAINDLTGSKIVEEKSYSDYQ